jgi:hypothetical protein
MGASSRRKGAEGEREVAAILRASGFDVQQLQRNRGDEFDLVASLRDYDVQALNITLVIEVKNRKTLKIPEWIERAETTVHGMTDAWVIVFPRGGSRHRPRRLYALMPLDDLLDVIT